VTGASSDQPPSAPSARVTPVVIYQNVAYVSGQLPRVGGELQMRGKVGADIDLSTAQAAAKLCAEACLTKLSEAVGRANIVRILKVTGFVASAPGFNGQGIVIDAASDVFLDQLGPLAGAHARSAVGVAELPQGSPVEVEIVAAVTASGSG